MAWLQSLPISSARVKLGHQPPMLVPLGPDELSLFWLLKRGVARGTEDEFVVGLDYFPRF